MTHKQPNRPRVGDLRDLIVWQVAIDLAEAIYRATRSFPEDERFGLRMQLRRAGVSVASNIAEGHGRINRREYARFILIARGSLKEAETQLLIAGRLGFLRSDTVTSLTDITNRTNQLLRGLHRRLSE